MKAVHYIVTLWMTGNILLAGFLAQSAQFHEWLHVGEEYCELEQSHCHQKGQKDHHHKGEGTEEHPHGLLSMMAGASMDTMIAPIICPEPDSTTYALKRWEDQSPCSSSIWAATLGRAPPTLS